MVEFDHQKTRLFLEEKNKKRQAQLDVKFKQATRDFEKIKNLIIQNYNPVRIYQWGSLLNRKQFSEISDIDIAVEGINSAEIFFKMYGEITCLSQFSIDLVQIDKIEPEFADIIKAKGKVVYERGK